MKAALLQAPQNLSVEEIREPKRPTGTDVLVQIRRIALCGSDIHYYVHGKNSSQVEFPIILGHEASGVVLEVGEGVTGLKPGDRVAIEPGKKCGQCKYCLRGQYQFCEQMRFMASKGYPGALQERVVWPEFALWKLPDGISLDEGALLEPLSVAYSAIEKIDFDGVSEALILGAGSIGLLLFKLMRHLHPHVEIVLVEKNRERFDLASKQGIAFDRCTLSDGQEPELPPVDVIIDTTGNSTAIEKGFRSLNQGGQLVLIGLSAGTFGLSVLDLVYKGVTLKGSYRYAHTYPKLLQLSNAHLFQTPQLITHRFDLDRAREAFETALASKNCLKAVIEL